MLNCHVRNGNVMHKITDSFPILGGREVAGGVHYGVVLQVVKQTWCLLQLEGLNLTSACFPSSSLLADCSNAGVLPCFAPALEYISYSSNLHLKTL